jgi:hypothetical protein
VSTHHPAHARERASDDEWNRQRRDETEAERLDRNLGELLQELRVAETGVQLLFAFLLTVPFTQRFEDVTRFERGVYFGCLLATTIASVFLIAPVAYHRLVFRRHDKERLVHTASWMALVGLSFLGLAICGCLFLISHVLFGHAEAIVAGVLAVMLVGSLWYALPMARREDIEPAEREG